jgi:hypothetical protein
LWRVRATVVAMEKQYLLHMVSLNYPACNAHAPLLHVFSLNNPACNAHAPFCQLWHAPVYNIFPHFLINGTLFEKNSY